MIMVLIMIKDKKKLERLIMKSVYITQRRHNSFHYWYVHASDFTEC